MSTEEQDTGVPNDETTEDRDQGEHSSRLSTDRDDSPAEAPAEDAAEAPAEDAEDQVDGDTFPRAYVERLRARSGGYRARARDAEARTGELERALFLERVRALDVLTDPSDLPYDPALLDDPDALADAARELVNARPHYARRGTVAPGDTGSRDRASTDAGVSLLGLMRG